LRRIAIFIADFRGCRNPSGTDGLCRKGRSVSLQGRLRAFAIKLLQTDITAIKCRKSRPEIGDAERQGGTTPMGFIDQWDIVDQEVMRRAR
jgi:hypothetical protein